MKLLVGSVFKNDEPYQIQWLKLQLAFLKETTVSFKHVSFVNSNEHSKIEELTEVVGYASEDEQVSKQHIRGLKHLNRYFQSVSWDYDNFLFIDNDAFPIRRGWRSLLNRKMEKSNKDVAVALRTENLEQRLHASILYCRTRKSLVYLDFSFGEPCKDLLEYGETDVGIGQYQNEFREDVYPLIRTNQLNVHPISCGVYFDMFYHHGFGSPTTSKKFRAQIRDYSTHYTGTTNNFAELHKDLMDDPCDFIKNLAGWSPDQYPEKIYL